MTAFVKTGMGEFAFEVCLTCGTWHGFPKAMYDAAQAQTSRGRRSFYCPNGHSWVYGGESRAEALQREVDRLRQDAARLEEEKAEAERAADKARKATTRLKKRAAAGVCPCCNRTFPNLAMHMSRKHPTFSEVDAQA